MEFTRLVATEDYGVCAERAKGTKVALLGEMTHGTADFHEARTEITFSLIASGFRVVALEADWPDAAAIDAYVRHQTDSLDPWLSYGRWPTWMWRNTSFLAFIERLRIWNRKRPEDDQVRVVGLDLYSMPESIAAVLRFLAERDGALAEAARARYDCLAGWQDDPHAYGDAVRKGLADRRDEAVEVLLELMQQRLDGGLFDAQQNARAVTGAEAFYRALYDADASSWDLRDTHMADTLDAVMAEHDARAVVWAHNSHIGEARRGTTLGTLCRERHATWRLGALTDQGTVTAGAHWDGPAKTMDVLPSRQDSHGHWLAGLGCDRMILRVSELDLPERLERAIGVVYRPSSERTSHYFPSRLQDRYDDVLWFEWTRAIEPLPARETSGIPETWPRAV